MRSFRFWLIAAIFLDVASTALAWVVNGDIISSIAVAALMPAAIAALVLAALRQFAIAGNMRRALFWGAMLLFLLCFSAVILAVFTSGAAGNLRPPAAVEAVTLAGGMVALLLAALAIALLRSGRISWPIAIAGWIAAAGQIVSNIDSISLLIIAASRAVMILFLVLLLQTPTSPDEINSR